MRGPSLPARHASELVEVGPAKLIHQRERHPKHLSASKRAAIAIQTPGQPGVSFPDSVGKNVDVRDLRGTTRDRRGMATGVPQRPKGTPDERFFPVLRLAELVGEDGSRW